MKILYLAIIIIIASLSSLIVGTKIQDYEQPLGTSLTTINATDLIKDSRAVINANFTALNTGKLEASSFFSTTTMPSITSLPALATVGTITSGVWSGTTLTVSKGGTGSTTLANQQLLFGNGTNGIQTIGFGNSGQFLTSGGANALPSWTSASVNQALDYTWTGIQTFNGTTTLAATTTINYLNVGSTTITQYPSASSSIASKGYVDAYKGSEYCWSSSDGLTVPDTGYLTYFYQALQSTFSTSTAFMATRNGLVTKMVLKPTVNNAQYGPAVYTIWKNGIATTMTLSVDAGSTTPQTDSTHTFNVVAGDLINIYGVNEQAGTGATLVTICLQID